MVFGYGLSFFGGWGRAGLAGGFVILLFGIFGGYCAFECVYRLFFLYDSVLVLLMVSYFYLGHPSPWTFESKFKMLLELRQDHHLNSLDHQT